MKILLSAILLFHVSCAQQFSSTKTQTNYPHFTGEFIPDVVNPRNDQDLAELITSLPIVEVDPNKRLIWILANAERSWNSIKIPTEGAGPGCELIRKSQSNMYLLVIQDTDKSTYELKRIAGGWKILSYKTSHQKNSGEQAAPRNR